MRFCPLCYEDLFGDRVCPRHPDAPPVDKEAPGARQWQAEGRRNLEEKRSEHYQNVGLFIGILFGMVLTLLLAATGRFNIRLLTLAVLTSLAGTRIGRALGQSSETTRRTVGALSGLVLLGGTVVAAYLYLDGQRKEEEARAAEPRRRAAELAAADSEESVEQERIKACNRKDVETCFQGTVALYEQHAKVMRPYRKDQQEPPSWKRGKLIKGLKTAEAAFSNLCDGGDMRSCLYLASMAEEGMPEQPDAPRAAEMYQKLCEKKVGEACYQLAELVSSQKLGATELRAINLYKAACDARFARGCSSAAARLTTGIGAQKDPKEAATYFWAACQLNEQEETEACQPYKPATPRP